MQPGQFVSQWMQEYMLGRLTTPQQIFAASRAEILSRQPVSLVLQWITPKSGTLRPAFRPRPTSEATRGLNSPRVPIGRIATLG